MSNKFATALKPKAQLVPETVEASSSEADPVSPHARPSRKSTKHVGGYFDPAVSKQLRKSLWPGQFRPGALGGRDRHDLPEPPQALNRAAPQGTLIPCTRSGVHTVTPEPDELSDLKRFLQKPRNAASRFFGGSGCRDAKSCQSV